MDTAAAENSQPSPILRPFRRLKELHQYYLDKITPYSTGRWIFWIVLSILYIIRVVILEGWYIITYGLGIYLLNLFIAFLSPKVDPAIQEIDDDGPSLPTKSGEEFRPFMRRLPEFKFWYSATKAVLIAMFCTCFDSLNIPVFWPILVMYFFLLFFLTMKRQIKHMLKYKYIPFTHGKAVYKSKSNAPPGAPNSFAQASK